MSDFDPRVGMKLAERRWFLDAKRKGMSDKQANAVARKMMGTTSAERVAAGHRKKTGSQQAKTDRLNDGIKAEQRAEEERLDTEDFLKGRGVGRADLV